MADLALREIVEMRWLEIGSGALRFATAAAGSPASPRPRRRFAAASAWRRL